MLLKRNHQSPQDAEGVIWHQASKQERQEVAEPSSQRLGELGESVAMLSAQADAEQLAILHQILGGTVPDAPAQVASEPYVAPRLEVIAADPDDTFLVNDIPYAAADRTAMAYGDMQDQAEQERRAQASAAAAAQATQGGSINSEAYFAEIGVAPAPTSPPPMAPPQYAPPAWEVPQEAGMTTPYVDPTVQYADALHAQTFSESQPAPSQYQTPESELDAYRAQVAAVYDEMGRTA